MQFEILGSLRVTDDNDRELAVGGSKRAALLALLILRPNEVVSIDRLIDDLWDGQAPASAAKTLQVHMSRLRRSLAAGRNGDGGDAIVTRGSGYALEVDPTHIDAERFKQLVTEGGAALAEGAHPRASARFRSALALWRGDPLADFTYASFAQDEIARLEAMRTVALESAVEAELALGRHTELIPELEMLVKRHPLSEHLRAQLMLALYRSNRQADALEVYRDARRALVDELGIEPGTALRELERAILAHDPVLARAPAPRESTDVADRAPATLFVGYERELSALEAALERTLAGAGGVALVAGEPGIGKTRLADELSRVARARGARVLPGRAWDGGGAPAYWPWIQSLRVYVRGCEPDSLRAQLGAGAAEVAELLPEVRELLPDVGPPEPGDAGDSRFRLFDALAQLLRRAAARQPLVLVLDDLHAADEPSLLLLQFEAAALADAPVLIVGTYRDTELGTGHRLRATLAELGRAGECARLRLGGLSRDDTAHFVELSAGTAPMPRLAAAIHDASDGSPMFVTELVRLLAAEARLHELEGDETLALPEGLDEVIARRLLRLSERCRRTLSVAAVIGREFEMAVVEAVGESSADELLEDLEEAIAARLVEQVPGTGERMRFSHELLRHALDRQLGASRRSRLHAAVGEALEHLYTAKLEPVLPRLAHHFAEALPAGSADKAVDYLRRAGQLAAGMLAYEESIRLCEQAVEIARASGAAGALRGELLVELAEQLVITGQPSRASDLLDQATALADDDLGDALAARIAVGRAHLDFLDAGSAGKERIREAIALFERLHDPGGEADAWWALRTFHHGLGQVGAAGAAAERMLECARRAGSKALASRAAVGIASALVYGPTPVSEALPRVVALRKETTNRRTEAELLMLLAELNAMRGHFTEARALIAEARAILAEIEGATDVVLAAACRRARVALLADDPAEAEEIARVGCDELERQGLIAYLRSDVVYIVDALTAQGRLEEAEAELARAQALDDDEDDVDAIQRRERARARIELARGNVEAAESAMRTALEYVMKMEWPSEHAESWLVMAHIRLAAGRDEEARAAVSETLAIAEAKEHAVYAGRARELLDSISAAAASRVA